MLTWKNYFLPRTIEEALQALAAGEGQASAIAGGTDLLLDIQQGRQTSPETLVDLTQIPELSILEMRQDELFVGASAPLSKIVASETVYRHAQALVEACGLIGGPQVRNTATLGGNVAHALPAGDGTIALLALDAQAEVASLEGKRRTPMVELFVGPGRSALDSQNEILTGFYLPVCGKTQGSAHRRVMRPQGVAIAILNMAVWISRLDQKISDIHISLGPAGPTPTRAWQAEEFLRNQVPDQKTLDDALQVLLDEVSLRTSPHRATSEYRQHLTSYLLMETVSAAWQRTFHRD